MLASNICVCTRSPLGAADGMLGARLGGGDGALIVAGGWKVLPSTRQHSVAASFTHPLFRLQGKQACR